MKIEITREQELSGKVYYWLKADGNTILCRLVGNVLDADIEKRETTALMELKEAKERLIPKLAEAGVSVIESTEI